MKSNLILLMAALSSGVSASALEKGFRQPPNSARPHTWYHLMNGNATKEGVTYDFEALAKAGIGGVQMFDVGMMPRGDVEFNSPEWFDLVHHAASEARRLGLELCLPNCSGWTSSGGPWIAPSNAMKRLVFSETRVKGPAAFRKTLPRTRYDNGFYGDVAVLAFPTPPAELAPAPDLKVSLSGSSATLSADKPFRLQGVSFRLKHPWLWTAGAEAKVEVSQDGRTFSDAGCFTVQLSNTGHSMPPDRHHSFTRPLTGCAVRLTFSAPCAVTVESIRGENGRRLRDLPQKTFVWRREESGAVPRDASVAEKDQTVPVGGCIPLTSCMSSDGTLVWNVPKGDWTVLRIGYVCNGRHNHPASKFGGGLEVDKLSADAVEFHFNRYVGRLLKKLGPLAGDVVSGFNNLLVDSYEVGSQNWTHGFERAFEKSAGYPILPWMPVLAGYVVGSVEESERFLEDFRRAVADAFAENYASSLARLCHRHGLKFSLEPYGNCPSDDLQYGETADIPMAEFWSEASSGDHSTVTRNSRTAATLAHVWGRRFAATESFTADPGKGGRWLTTPFTVKAQCDRAYADGINRIIYHRFVHQPWPGNVYLPGMTMGRWGMHFDRTQTWWHLVGDWLSYQSRCQWMLQEGTFAADVLYYCGERTPNGGSFAEGGDAEAMKLPFGYDWDVCATKALESLTVVGGRIVAPGGVRYRLLVLPMQKAMSVRTLKAVEWLLDAGAKVCALSRPERAPGLKGGPGEDARVRKLVGKVWAKGVMECRPSEALARLGVTPDFASGEMDQKSGAVYIHRTSAEADWYFVALNNRECRSFEASFRQTGRQPEIWDAEKGTVTDAPIWREENGRTVLTLDFPPSGSAFVVFRRPAVKGSGTKTAAAVKETVLAVDGGWSVTFPVDWYTGGSATKTLDLPSLEDWSTNGDPDIRHFSGTATYVKRVPHSPISGARTILDLGKVKNFAVVTVNGKAFPALWRPPFRVDITEALDAKRDAFDLEVKVTNLWPNRLIGDDAMPVDCEWKGAVRDSVKEIGVKTIPEWVKEGRRSPTGRNTFTTWRHWAKDEPLLPSGLLGPVAIRQTETKND